MAVKSGIGASLGAAAETTYGTYVAPNHHWPFTSEDLRLAQEYVESGGLQAGVLSQNAGLVAQTTRRATGGFTLDAITKGLGLILNQLHGNTITLTGSGAAKTQVHEVGKTAPDGKSLSVQVGVPDTTGTVQPKTVPGAVISAIEFNLEVGGIVTIQVSLEAQDLKWTETLSAPVYPSGFEVFGFRDSTLTIDGASVGSCVKSARIRIEFPRKTDRYCLNGAGTPLEPITNDKIKVSGEYRVELTGTAQINAYLNATHRALKLRCLGKTDIATDTKAELTFDIADYVAKEGTPVVAGADVLEMDVPFDAYASGSTAPLTITYVSTDTAI